MLRERKAQRRAERAAHLPVVDGVFPSATFVAYLDNELLANYNLSRGAFQKDFRRLCAPIDVEFPAGPRSFDVHATFLASEAAVVVHTQVRLSSECVAASRGAKSLAQLDREERSDLSAAIDDDANEGDFGAGLEDASSRTFERNDPRDVAAARDALRVRYFEQNENRLLGKKLCILSLQEHVKVVLRLTSTGMFYKVAKLVRVNATSSDDLQGPGFTILSAELLPSSPQLRRCVTTIQALVRRVLVRKWAVPVQALYREYLKAGAAVLHDHYRFLWGADGAASVTAFTLAPCMRDCLQRRYRGYTLSLPLSPQSLQSAAAQDQSLRWGVRFVEADARLLAFQYEECALRNELRTTQDHERHSLVARFLVRFQEEEAFQRRNLITSVEQMHVFMQQDLLRGLLHIEALGVFFSLSRRMAKVDREEIFKRTRIAAQELSARAQVHQERFIGRTAIASKAFSSQQL